MPARFGHLGSSTERQKLFAGKQREVTSKLKIGIQHKGITRINAASAVRLNGFINGYFIQNEGLNRFICTLVLVFPGTSVCVPSFDLEDGTFNEVVLGSGIGDDARILQFVHVSVPTYCY